MNTARSQFDIPKYFSFSGAAECARRLGRSGFHVLIMHKECQLMRHATSLVRRREKPRICATVYYSTRMEKTILESTAEGGDAGAACSSVGN